MLPSGAARSSGGGSGGAPTSFRRGFASSVPSNPTRQQYHEAMHATARIASGATAEVAAAGWPHGDGLVSSALLLLLSSSSGSAIHRTSPGAEAASANPSQAAEAATERSGDPADLAVGCVFTKSPNYPGVPIVYRTAAQRAENSERLNLDRINLATMPLLEGEHRLRLLNYQNNMLRKICHLQGLPNLIFLTSTTTALNVSKAWRASRYWPLMLGKNSIRNVENLELSASSTFWTCTRIASPKFSGHRISQSCGCSTCGDAVDVVDNLSSCGFDRAQSEAESDPAVLIWMRCQLCNGCS